MARLAAPLGYRKPVEPMPRAERHWYDGIATTLRSALSRQPDPDLELGDAVSRLKQLD